MSSPQVPHSAIPKPLPDDDDDVSWALQTAAVQWGRGAYDDAIVWMRRAAESAIEGTKWSRAADLNAMATRLEKQLGKLPPTPSVEPSAPPRQALLPSLPTPPTSSLPSSGIGSLPSARRQASGAPPLPVPSKPAWSVPAPSSSGRLSVDISIEADVGELTEEELQAIETEDAPAAVRPQGGRAGRAAPPPPVPRLDASSAPGREPPRPLPPPVPAASISALPAFSLEPSTRPPAAGFTAPSPGSGQTSSLPSFPLDVSTSSLPPVSKWPRIGSPGTSHLPPNPALPKFETVPPSRPFLDDGDDGAPGVEEPLLPEHALEELEPLEIEAREEPPSPSAAPQSTEALDLVEIDGAASFRGASTTPTSLGRLSVRAGRASTRPRTTSAPLPPALPDAQRKTSAPATVRAAPRRALGEPPPVPESSRPPVPTRSSSASPIEPRMPKRTLSYAAPLDFGGKTGSFSSPERISGRPFGESVSGLASNRPISAAPAAKRIDTAESKSVVPPPSTRSLEPEDLPTVSSPSLSRPPPETREHPPSETPSVGRIAESREDNRRLSFRFEEPKTLERSVEELRYTDSPAGPLSVTSQIEEPDEPLAVLPPVVTHPAVESQQPGMDSGTDEVILSGVRLADVRGFSELSVSAHRMLARTARIETLATGEEASFFSVALVLDGWVALMPAIADTTCATAVVGEVVFTEGTLSDGLMLRVVAGQDDVAVATWDAQAMAEATEDCSWIADDLKLLADGFQALAGACLGPLGDRLDDSLRSIVTSRCEIRTLMPGEQLCAAGKPVPGMHIVGGGEVELVDESGRVTKTYGTGEFLFAPQVLAGGVVPFAARAGDKGALVLFAPRMAAHELLVSVPPLLEILAE